MKRNKAKIKKIILLFIVSVLMISSLIVPAYASYAGVEIPQNRYLTGCWTPSPRFQVTYNDQVGTHFFGADLDNTYYANDNGTVWGYNEEMTYTSLHYDPQVFDEVTVTYNQVNDRQYMYIPSTELMKNNQNNIHEVTYTLSSLAGVTKFINETWIDLFLPTIELYSENGDTDYTTRNETWSCYVTCINVREIPKEEQTLQGPREEKHVAQYYVQADSRQQFIQRILNPASSGYNVTTPYDIIGITALRWTITADTDTYGAGSDLMIEYGASITGDVYNTEDFIAEATSLSTDYGALIEQTVKEKEIEYVYETIYNNTLDLSGFMNTVRTMLTVDIIGTLSVMDMLTIVVGVGITIWFLKVFAGG